MSENIFGSTYNLPIDEKLWFSILSWKNFFIPNFENLWETDKLNFTSSNLLCVYRVNFKTQNLVSAHAWEIFKSWDDGTKNDILTSKLIDFVTFFVEKEKEKFLQCLQKVFCLLFLNLWGVHRNLELNEYTIKYSKGRSG